MHLHKRLSFDQGYTEVFQPGSDGLEELGLGVLCLDAARTYKAETGDREVALVILSGKVHVRVDDHRWTDLGQRSNVFDGPATTVYVPSGATYEVEAVQACEIAVCSAPGDPDLKPYVIRPDDVIVHDRGDGPFRRIVQDIIDESRASRHLVVGETFNQPGCWSSYPPHKHDVDDPPAEYKMEEVYLFQVNPSQGFGMQGLYSKNPERPLDEAHIIKHGDAVALPYGYHPVAAAPGYELYYLWFLSGSTRKLVPNDDPDHAWVKEADV